MIKNKQSLKENFVGALKHYKNKDFKAAEFFCNKILSINSNHYNPNEIVAQYMENVYHTEIDGVSFTKSPGYSTFINEFNLYGYV